MIIKNGKVFIDGSYHEVDVRITNGVIREIGCDLKYDEVYDAKGQYVLRALWTPIFTAPVGPIAERASKA